MSLKLPSNTSSACPHWLLILMQAMPSLLAKLLHQAQPPSLERMQLIGLRLALHQVPEQESIQPTWQHREIHKKDGQQLTLSGSLFYNEDKMLDVTLEYFIRGQRQYYRHPALPKLDSVTHMPAVSHEDIRIFFASLNHPCDFFIDEDLALLNGQQQCTIPSFMMIAMLIHHALEKNPLATEFEASFFQAPYAQIPLTLATSKTAPLLGFITQEGTPLASITFR